ncbi:hypothetical protein [Actinoplanes sp. NPDC051411]|uniref:hypothetical protein n=1 Tax=Actinoplanes sp. NPDC051411 TaxID=3155522 RepID=UPI00342F8474
MSYDLAVWEGARPDDDDAAIEEFEVLYERYLGAGGTVTPTPRIAAYVTALLDRYPDIDTEAGFHDSPWASAPLMSEASGPLVYFPMVAGRGDETAVWAARVAEEHGLVCFDPQTDQLRTPWGTPWRFEFTSVFGDSVRNPDDVGDILVQLTVDDPFALLTAADGSYLRVECTRPGLYTLERGDGSRTEDVGLDEVTRAFAQFLAA